MACADVETPHLVAPPLAIYGGALLAGLLINRARPRPVLASGIVHPIGLVLLVVGALIAGWAQLAMYRSTTSSLPFRPAATLVEEGPFRYSRNPMYVAFTLAYVGVSLLTNAVAPLLILPAVLAVMIGGVVRREERYLARRFGDQYADYTARVRRWL